MGVIAGTTWTEEGVSGGTVTAVDHYPLVIYSGEQFNYVVGSNDVPIGADRIWTIKFRLDRNIAYWRWYFLASNATVTIRVLLNGTIISETAETVTTEEATYCQVNMPDIPSSGLGEIYMTAKGGYQIKGDTMKLIAYWISGWTEEGCPVTTTWTEETIV